ncbi:MAG TPA: S8 family serine peptidase, partial [Myxococcota bacterium]|nr:S8 family serine peptidase [Myxococcota bacterium]
MLLLILNTLAADDSFYPNEGDRRLSLSALQAEGSILGRSGRLLLSLRDPAEVGYLSQIKEVAHIQPLRGDVYSLSLRPGTDDLALARKLHADPHIAWVHPDLILPLRLLSVPNDPFVADEWHVEHIDLPLAWDYASGEGQIIAVVDSGVQVGHPDLRLLPGVDLLDDDTDPTPDDGNGHGTSVSGVAASIGNNSLGTAGVAWAAEVYPVRMIGGATTNQDVYDAITGSVDAGAGVVNNSWGFGRGCVSIPLTRTFEAMFDYAELRGRGGLGTVVTFAAGNDGCDIVENEFLSDSTALVVAAVERDDHRAGYSSFGEAVDIAAPTGLLTTDLSPNGYGSYQGEDAFADGFGGTSAATPVVSGVVALMLQANPR